MYFKIYKIEKADTWCIYKASSKHISVWSEGLNDAVREQLLIGLGCVQDSQ